MDVSFLPKIMEIDALCYEAQYVGELRRMEARYERNPRSFVCITDGETIAGYINFFPTQPALWKEITQTGMTIRDDDIEPSEIADYTAEENNLFIISVAIRPEYRGKQAITALTDAFIDYLNQLESEGFPIKGISATAVSLDGMRFLSSRMFGLYREIEGGNKVYLCKGDYLRCLLKGNLYFKTHKDDMYLFLPYADNVKNVRIDAALYPDGESPFENIPETAFWLLQSLNDCLHYEYQDFADSNMKLAYLDEFRLMHTLDDYPEEDDARPHIVGEETVYLSLLAHQPSHMYVLLLFIPDCRYSSSQLEDQLSQGYLKIRRPEDMDGKGFYQYRDLNDYLWEEYGLLPCGKGKSILCMSGKPENENELLNILSAEAYNSMHQNFRIRSASLREKAELDKSVYDYYEAYMTSDVIAFILYDYEKLQLKERIGLTATYIFIVELVLMQNTALNKMTVKVSNALSTEGDVSYQYISQLYKDYAKTIKFWEANKFKYYGTQKEASQIREAFHNEEIKQSYYEQQDFLEHIVDLKNAQLERRNGNIINIVAIILAIFQVQEYAVGLLTNFYAHFNIAVESASNTFNVMVIGGCGLCLIVWYVLYRKNMQVRKKKLKHNGGGKL